MYIEYILMKDHTMHICKRVINSHYKSVQNQGRWLKQTTNGAPLTMVTLTN